MRVRGNRNNRYEVLVTRGGLDAERAVSYQRPKAYSIFKQMVYDTIRAHGMLDTLFGHEHMAQAERLLSTPMEPGEHREMDIGTTGYAVRIDLSGRKKKREQKVLAIAARKEEARQEREAPTVGDYAREVKRQLAESLGVPVSAITINVRY